jgi:hypothetical protein
MKGFRQFLEADDDSPVRIKLRMAKHTPGVENFIQALANVSRTDRGTGLTVFMTPQGYARYKAKPDPFRNNAVYLTDLVVLPEQAGVGIDFMRTITKLADKYGIDLVIYPKPIDDSRPEITTERLRKFYSRFGFESVDTPGKISEDMIRKHKDELEKMAQDISVDISQYDKEELKKGIEVEKEHMKDKDINVIRNPSDVLKIALAHLREDPKYYTKLKKMENA